MLICADQIYTYVWFEFFHNNFSGLDARGQTSKHIFLITLPVHRNTLPVPLKTQI